MFEESGHDPHAEEPVATIALIREFLRKEKFNYFFIDQEIRERFFPRVLVF